jgi:cytochrome P450
MNYLKTGDTASSIYAQVREQVPDFKDENAMANLVSIMFAGHETSARSFCSALYCLAKNPEVLQKLRGEIMSHRTEDMHCLQDLMSNDLISSCDYLHNVIKETLRIDSPTFGSLIYEVIKDVEITGVPLCKGTSLVLNNYALHSDKTQYRDIDKLIPERFDPESEYFFKPNSTEHRDNHSYFPFSGGLRICPGKNFAMYQLKLLVAYFIMSYEYVVDPEQLDNPHISFSLGSQFELKLKITKKTNFFS